MALVVVAAVAMVLETPVVVLAEVAVVGEHVRKNCFVLLICQVLLP
jgi:hypothetical protein